MTGEEGELRLADVKGPINPGTRNYTSTPGALVYAGIGKVQSTDTIGNQATASERIVVTSRFEVHLPMNAPAASVDCVWTQKVSADPELVGRRFRVASLIHKSHMTARRLAVEEIQS